MRSDRAILALLTAALVTGCGEGGLPCERCPETCFKETECGDGGCTYRSVACAVPCESNLQCVLGHACTDQPGGQRLCSPYCDSTICPERSECRGELSVCQQVDCGFITPCLDPARICDPWAHQCFPYDGSCAEDFDCPHFDGRIGAVAEVACTASYCRVSTRPLEIPDELEGITDVEVHSPQPAAELVDDASVVVEWSGPPGASIALILDTAPYSSDDVLRHALWGVSVPRGGERRVRIADGMAIRGGEWRPGLAADLPTGQSLYLFVTVLDQGRLLGSSELLPFIIGGEFPDHGATCDDPGEVPGGCLHPLSLQGCHPTINRCAKICLSYLDCLGLPVAADCGTPIEGVRYCE